MVEDRFEMDERTCGLHGVDSQLGGKTFQRSEMRAMIHPDDQAFVRRDLDHAFSSGAVLLSNACKYNSRGGRLWLQYGEGKRCHWVSIGGEGAGMSEVQLGEIFRPFKQLPARTEVSGTDLGLVVVKLLMEQMHGSVSVESEAGRGSVFTVKMERMLRPNDTNR